MRRLYLRIYFAVLASLVAFALAAGVLWRTLAEPREGTELGVIARNVLAPAHAPPSEQQAALERVARGARMNLALFGADGTPLAAIGVGTYPVVRRLTQRLERLQRGVDALGAGELSARVKVEGKDEVARLAESFNRAAARIEELVGAHKSLLANASHELRTPLARIRMALELGKDKREVERDIAELDALIDEVLLASRLDAVTTLENTE